MAFLYPKVFDLLGEEEEGGGRAGRGRGYLGHKNRTTNLTLFSNLLPKQVTLAFLPAEVPAVNSKTFAKRTKFWLGLAWSCPVSQLTGLTLWKFGQRLADKKSKCDVNSLYA